MYQFMMLTSSRPELDVNVKLCTSEVGAYIMKEVSQ
jgi:hypothetical protein